MGEHKRAKREVDDEHAALERRYNEERAALERRCNEERAKLHQKRAELGRKQQGDFDAVRRQDAELAWPYGFAQKNQLARSPHRKKMATELARSAQKKFRPQKKQLARSERRNRAS
eukprot:COSAG04_NODE_3371_length_2880_cov_7.944984_4_plen_116_part_00